MADQIKYDQITWVESDNEGRPLTVNRPCSCGCDLRDGKHDNYAGYIMGSTGAGTGFTIWIKEEEIYQVISDMIRNLKKKARG